MGDVANIFKKEKKRLADEDGFVYSKIPARMR
jgi:hypothetical protein